MEYRHNTDSMKRFINAVSGTLLRTRVLMMPICGTAAGLDTIVEGRMHDERS